MEYRFICGLEDVVSAEDAKRFYFWGEMEACLHACPNPKINGNIHNCPAFKNWYYEVAVPCMEKENGK